MDSRLIPLNGLIALANGEGGWPKPFGDAGYVIHGLELMVMPAAGRKVVIDAMLRHDASRTVTLGECKGGQNLRETQMTNYLMVGSSHVARQVGVPFRDPGVEVLVVGLAAHRVRLAQAMRGLGIDLPMLLIGEDHVELCQPLAGVTTFTLPVPGSPPRIIAIDADSSTEELLGQLLPHLMAAAARSKEVVGVDELLQGAIPWWSVYDRDAGQAVLLKKATDALAAMINAEFNNDFRLEHRAGQCAVVRILRTPAAYRPRGVTQGWQRLQRSAERALGRRTSKREAPGQIAFSFEELGLDAQPSGEDE